MTDNLLLKFSIANIDMYKQKNSQFLNLSEIEKYKFIKNIILESDTVVFFIMTGCFLNDIYKFSCMKTLKSKSLKYKKIIIDYPELNYKEYEEPVDDTFCYCLDISTDEKKKIFFDNYCFYGSSNFILDLPKLNTSFKVEENRFYMPYIFYFLKDMQVKMVIAHHTKEIMIN